MSNISAPPHAQPIDGAQKYDFVSRVLHWGMAALFLWQLCSAFAHQFLEDTAIEGFFWAGHYPVGVLLLLLAFFRGLWGLATLPRRPKQAPGVLGVAARLGHLALYLLMIATPALALLRAFGSGRGFSVLGIEIFAPGGARVDWMVEAGSLLHGELGWVFFALIFGHVVMALAHGRLFGREVLSRMGVGRRTA